MQESTNGLANLLADLTREARRLGLTDTKWSERAGVRKETLSRLRRRRTCDFSTLDALAQAVEARVGMVAARTPGTVPGGHYPDRLDRDYEARLVELCSSQTLEARRWASLGPPFFMAGLAVMLASSPGFDRRGLLELAEGLHPGASEPAVFGRWLERSPVRPSRFLPLVRVGEQRAA